MTNQNTAAEAVRENARRSDGKFGAQPAIEADIDLAAELTVAELQDLRTEIGQRIVEAQGAGDAQADFEASAAYQRATLKMVGTALRESGLEADSLYFAPDGDGLWELSVAMDRDGGTVDVGETVPGTSTTWEDVGCALLTRRDGFHTTDMAHCHEDTLVVLVDSSANARLENPAPQPSTREAFVSWQRATTAMERLQQGEDAMSDEEYATTVRAHQRHAVKTAAVVLAEEYPEARYIYLEQNGDGERQFDVVGLTDGEDNRLEEDMDAYELQIAGGAMQLCEVGYVFTREDASYVDDVLDEHIKRPTNERFIIIDLEKAAAMDPDAQTEPTWGTRS